VTDAMLFVPAHFQMRSQNCDEIYESGLKKFLRSETDPISLLILLVSSCYCWGDAVQRSLRYHCFKSDWDEIFQDCSSSK